MRFYVGISQLDALLLHPYTSTMIDNDLPGVARDNIRSLIYLFGSELDQRIAAFRRGTPYEHVRASDIRVFVYASAGNSSISEVARLLGISRQAVHMSAQRLKELGVLDLTHAQPGRRDVLMQLTAKGHHARQTADAQIERLEGEIAEIIGPEGLQTFRRTLQVLIDHTRHKHGQAPPQASYNGNGIRPPA
jgi:DNA-binding MarR family transcriptional regulator